MFKNLKESREKMKNYSIKNSKAFTLIELLAVIIILAVIALIATPVVLNVVDKAKIKSNMNSVYGIADTAKLYYIESQLDTTKSGHLNGQINLFTTSEFIYGGGTFTKDKSSVKVTIDGKIGVSLYFKGTCYTKDYESNDVTMKETNDNCIIDDAIVGKYAEAILNGNDPVLDNGLIPVVHDGTNWVVANPSSQKWYKYADRQWANAIIVNPNKKAEYIAKKEVVEADVLAYMVWVPRYEYYFDATNIGADKNKPGAIDIKFTTSPTVTDKYTMHPAFTFDNKQQKGLWVGKFETTGTAENPTIKPGITSLKSQNVSTQFNTAQKFNESSKYGLTNADSHMMKNTEWGAVAYLTQSIYGRCTSITSCTEVGINNNSSYLTGYGAPAGSASSVANGAYTTALGQGASTTGNITGIYDMSGGAWEYVMGNFATNGKNGSGSSASYNSGFNGWLGSDAVEKTDGIAFPDPKYFDSYTTSNGINGDATNADNTNGFYGDSANFTGAITPWLVRGGYYVDSTSAGIFAFGNVDGDGYSSVGFRVCFCR